MMGEGVKMKYSVATSLLHNALNSHFSMCFLEGTGQVPWYNWPKVQQLFLFKSFVLFGWEYFSFFLSFIGSLVKIQLKFLIYIRGKKIYQISIQNSVSYMLKFWV